MGQSPFLAFIMRLANIFVLTLLGVMSLARARPNEADPTIPKEDSTVPEEDPTVSVDDINAVRNAVQPAACSPWSPPGACWDFWDKPPNVTESEENRTVSAEEPTVSEQIDEERAMTMTSSEVYPNVSEENTPAVLTSSEENRTVSAEEPTVSEEIGTPDVLPSSEEEAFLTQEMDESTPNDSRA